MSNVCHVNIKLRDKAYSTRYTEKTFVHLCLVQNVRVFPNTSHKQTVNHHVHISRSLQTRCFYILNQFSLVLDHIMQILEFISRHGSGEALDIIPYIPQKQKPSVWREQNKGQRIALWKHLGVAANWDNVWCSCGLYPLLKRQRP